MLPIDPERSVGSYILQIDVYDDKSYHRRHDHIQPQNLHLKRLHRSNIHQNRDRDILLLENQQNEFLGTIILTGRELENLFLPISSSNSGDVNQQTSQTNKQEKSSNILPTNVGASLSWLKNTIVKKSTNTKSIHEEHNNGENIKAVEGNSDVETTNKNGEMKSENNLVQNNSDTQSYRLQQSRYLNGFDNQYVKGVILLSVTKKESINNILDDKNSSDENKKHDVPKINENYQTFLDSNKQTRRYILNKNHLQRLEKRYHSTKHVENKHSNIAGVGASVANTLTAGLKGLSAATSMFAGEYNHSFVLV